MDCPAEEQLVKMALDGFPGVQGMNFNLGARTVAVVHTGLHDPITAKLESLSLDTTFVESTETEVTELPDHGQERRILWIVFFINFSFFAIEMVTGLISGSMGLVADSLDMLADCLVFAMALFVVGGTIARKKGVARISGYFQLALATFGIIEVGRRFLGYGEVPDHSMMIVIASLALISNAASIYILRQARRDEAHMQASYIFLSNDVIINAGVITAGILVYFTASKFPDLIIGSMIFLVVARGALRILKLGTKSPA